MGDEEQTSQLTLMISELATKMQVLIDKQEELGVNISKIKEAVYDPDKGLYARLSRLDARLDSLEVWKTNNSKILWIIITMGLGLILSTVWQGIVTQ